MADLRLLADVHWAFVKDFIQDLKEIDSELLNEKLTSTIQLDIYNPSVSSIGYFDIILLFLILFFTFHFVNTNRWIFDYLCGSSNSKKIILVLGPCDAGKTTLSMQLITGKFFATVTSTSPLTSDVMIGDNNFNLIDFPGHPKLLYKLDGYIKKATYILLLIDCTRKDSAIAAANLAYNIVTNFKLGGVKLLCICNKNDQIISRPMDSVRKDFLQHLSTLSLKSDDRHFFKDWCSISSKKGDIKAVLDFLAS